jgi:hypothetical protein
VISERINEVYHTYVHALHRWMFTKRQPAERSEGNVYSFPTKVDTLRRLVNETRARTVCEVRWNLDKFRHPVLLLVLVI